MAGQTVAFHLGSLGVGGVEAAVRDYALWNERLLRNRSLIFTPQEAAHHSEEGAKRFAGQFTVVPYQDWSSIDKLLQIHKVDTFYIIKPGVNDAPLPKNARCVVHAVFKHRDPHGDVYAYISEWLSKEMSGGNLPFVPHIVDLPQVSTNLREELGIPSYARVFGRHGSSNTFDISFVRELVAEFADHDPGTYFLFMNTSEFCGPRKNIIHLPATVDLEYKCKFINSCDVMLHGRAMGETFGLAVAEFAFLGKPVITWSGSLERCHIELLGKDAILYHTPDDLIEILKTFTPGAHRAAPVYRQAFTPQIVMQKFEQVFLS